MKRIHQTTKKRDKDRKWKVLSSIYALKTPWLKVRRDRIQLPNGKIINDFFSVEGNKLVAILAVNKKNEVLLVKQYRHAIGRETFDLPGGGVKKNELPMLAAKRELVEETGYSAGRMQEMMTYYPDSGKKGDIKHVFLARDLKRRDRIIQAERGDEIMNIRWLSLNKVADDIANGKFKEATLQLVVLYYLHYFSDSRPRD